MDHLSLRLSLSFCFLTCPFFFSFPLLSSASPLPLSICPFEQSSYDFSYSSSGESSVDADSENAYYNAKGLKETSLDSAAKAFWEVVHKEEEDGKERTLWGFKCLKQLIKVYGVQSDPESLIKCYHRLLQYVSSNSVTQNVSEKAINGILDRVSMEKDTKLLNDVYEKVRGRLVHFIRSRSRRVWPRGREGLGRPNSLPFPPSLPHSLTHSETLSPPLRLSKCFPAVARRTTGSGSNAA